MTAAETWPWADWIALSKSALLTQDAEPEALAGSVEVVDVVDDVLEHATRSMNGIAAAATQRCIARFCPVEAPNGNPSAYQPGGCSSGHLLRPRFNAPATSTDTVW